MVVAPQIRLSARRARRALWRTCADSRTREHAWESLSPTYTIAHRHFYTRQYSADAGAMVCLRVCVSVLLKQVIQYFILKRTIQWRNVVTWPPPPPPSSSSVRHRNIGRTNERAAPAPSPSNDIFLCTMTPPTPPPPMPPLCVMHTRTRTARDHMYGTTYALAVFSCVYVDCLL